MRKIPWSATLLVALVAAGSSPQPALADEYVLNQNQNGFDLPGVTLPQGQDEVRAADGTTCRSAVSGSGAYMDVGVIGNRGFTGNGDFASYGRVVVPLGRKSKRLDCSKLYELEVERLRLELELLKMGAGSTTSGEIVSSTTTSPESADAGAPVTNTKPATKRQKVTKKAWLTDGWTANER